MLLENATRLPLSFIIQGEHSKLTHPFLYAECLTLLSNQWKFVQCIPDMFSLSFVCFHWPLYSQIQHGTKNYKGSGSSEKSGIRNMQVTKQCKILTKTIYNVMKWIKETGKTSSKTIHHIKCSVGLRFDSQTVNSDIGWNFWKKVTETLKNLKMAPKSSNKILKEGLP